MMHVSCLEVAPPAVCLVFPQLPPPALSPLPSPTPPPTLEPRPWDHAVRPILSTFRLYFRLSFSLSLSLSWHCLTLRVSDVSFMSNVFCRPSASLLTCILRVLVCF